MSRLRVVLQRPLWSLRILFKRIKSRVEKILKRNIIMLRRTRRVRCIRSNYYGNDWIFDNRTVLLLLLFCFLFSVNGRQTRTTTCCRFKKQTEPMEKGCWSDGVWNYLGCLFSLCGVSCFLSRSARTRSSRPAEMRYQPCDSAIRP